MTAAEHAYATKVAPAADSVIASDKAGLASAQSAMETAKQQMALAEITSPINGTVISVTAVAGTNAGSGYVIQVQTDVLQVTADFTETDLPSLAVGQPASVTIKAVNATVDAVVSSIAPMATSTSTGSVVTYPVTITLQNPPDSVRVGMSAQVAVTTASATGVLSIPSVALRGTARGYSVEVLDETGQPQVVAVTVGLIANGAAEIKTGLSEGERVVTGTVSARQGATTTGGAAGIGIPGVGGAGGFGAGGFGGGTGGAGGAGGRGGGTRTTP